LEFDRVGNDPVNDEEALRMLEAGGGVEGF
jgi:hypothetical protein